MNNECFWAILDVGQYAESYAVSAESTILWGKFQRVFVKISFILCRGE